MLRMIVYTLGFILLYRFIVNFIIPLFRITRLAGERVRQMQDQMNNVPPPGNANGHMRQQPPRVQEGDYIDYEEIK